MLTLPNYLTQNPFQTRPCAQKSDLLTLQLIAARSVFRKLVLYQNLLIAARSVFLKLVLYRNLRHLPNHLDYQV